MRYTRLLKITDRDIINLQLYVYIPFYLPGLPIILRFYQRIIDLLVTFSCKKTPEV